MSALHEPATTDLEPCRRDAESVVASLESDAGRGLSAAEAAQRLAR